MKRLFFILIFLFIFIQFNYSQVQDAYIFFPTKHKQHWYTLADGIRIRSQPSLNGEIIGRIPLNSRIKIISTPGNVESQTIDGVTAYWYLIEYENINGYIWGGFIAKETLIFDIDNNGIDDYFHSRVSSVGFALQYNVDSQKDIFIYINNIKISTKDIISRSSNNLIYNEWGACFFKLSERNTVLIHLYISDHGYQLEDIFEIDKTGKITLIERTETLGESDY